MKINYKRLYQLCTDWTNSEQSANNLYLLALERLDQTLGGEL